MKTWQEEAQGIEPWRGAMFLDADGKSRLCTAVSPSSDYMPEARTWCEARDYPTETVAPDISDPDTRRNFDARLALRLGAPADKVNEGVNFYGLAAAWYLSAGGPHSMRRNAGGSAGLPIVSGTTDALLARALAWRSVP